MSLRAQLTLAFTILITLIVTVSGFVAVRSAEKQLAGKCFGRKFCRRKMFRPNLLSVEFFVG